MSERVWDRFLTERDHADVARRPTKQWGMGSSPALVLVDLYRKAFGSGSGDADSVTEAAWTALPHLQALLSSAREAGIPVIHLTGVTEHFRWSDPAPENAASMSTQVGSPERRRDYEIIPELAPIDGEMVVSKAGPSGFWGTALASLLTRHGVDSVIIGGESTSGCVRATVIDARSHQYRVSVVEECVFDRHEAPHAINLFDMDRKYADVVSLPEIQRYLGQL